MRVDGVKLIAFYLPQYHPIPENDHWWGKGFSEWRNVVRARPLFRGHYQPRFPADLGFYDLRLGEVRNQQAELAKSYGIYGFCYYHYWFCGNRLLERPFDEVLKSGTPDFPFCLCWANENWTRAWDGRSGEIIKKQRYSPEDDLNHIRWLCRVFRDERYIRINGKPLFMVYRASQLPNPVETTAIWREEATKGGIGEIYLSCVQSFADEHEDPGALGFDAAVEFQPDWRNIGEPMRGEGLRFKLTGISRKALRENQIYDYGEIARMTASKPLPEYPYFRCVMPSWDNTPRRKSNATIFHGSTPELYREWLVRAISKAGTTPFTERITFINAWNEWGEGNHLEPCRHWGHAYLEATLNALNAKSVADLS